MPRRWIRLNGGRLKRDADRQRPNPRRWRERRVHTREMRLRENRRLRRVTRECLAAGSYDDLPRRTPLSSDEWMLH